MAEFIVRAHAAPVDPERFRAAIGSGAGVEYLAAILSSALFVSQDHRSEAHITLVLENSHDFSRCLTFTGDSLGSLPGQHESDLLEVIIDALESGKGLGKEETCIDSRGITVSATSFEHLVKEKMSSAPVYLADPKGEDLREVDLSGEAVFLLTDHVPLPKKIAKSLEVRGAIKVSVGPRMLHASQCITLIQNELDRRAL